MQAVLGSCRRLPEIRMRSGTSCSRNWYPLATGGVYSANDRTDGRPFDAYPCYSYDFLKIPKKTDECEDTGTKRQVQDLDA